MTQDIKPKITPSAFRFRFNVLCQDLTPYALLGAGLVLAFAPFNLYCLAWVLPGVLFLRLRHSTVKHAVFYGFVFGVGLFLVGSSWVYISIHRYGNSGVVLAGFLTLVFISFLALFYAAQLGLYVWLKQRLQLRSLFSANLVFNILWLGFEYLRCNLWTGFPWLVLGYSQTNGLLKSLAPIIGVYGLSLIVLLLNGAWCVLLKSPKKISRLCALAGISLLALVCLALYDKQWTKPMGKTIKVSLIQANIAQSIKWDPVYLRHILQRYRAMTEQQAGARLIVWPEGAIPLPKQYAMPFIERMASWAKQQGATIIAGNIVARQQQAHYYNALISFGLDQGEYDKRQLVPFGEFIPLKMLLRPIMRHFAIPMSDLTQGATQQNLLTLGPIKLAPVICYEIAYPRLMRSAMPQANAIIYASDDSWFGDSIASYQQLQFAKMRALETGRYVLSASNTGITAMISPTGNVIKQLPRNQRGVLNVLLPAMQGKTPLLAW